MVIKVSSPSLGGWGCSGPRGTVTPSHDHGRNAGAGRVGRPSGARLWALAVLPLGLLGGLLGVLAWSGPFDALRGEGYPPVEELAFQRVELGPVGIVATVLNDGPDPVTIAQIQVDDAYWSFTAEPGTTLTHLGRTTLTIPYPWVAGRYPPAATRDLNRGHVRPRGGGGGRDPDAGRQVLRHLHADRSLRGGRFRWRSDSCGCRSSRGRARPVSISSWR